MTKRLINAQAFRHGEPYDRATSQLVNDRIDDDDFQQSLSAIVGAHDSYVV
jgi:hypothetical protein